MTSTNAPYVFIHLESDWIPMIRQAFLSRRETVLAEGRVPKKDFPALGEAFVNHLR